ncbi:hypothetical protein EHQ76_05150 [Leptospira barantonii]|uniref:Uncharacterized protein n=1 Tax=Leptospira barantonii TaxID=2023184 RepID=A0A5F2BNI1_9LEPT|nr:hypothetical protein EHQ76_05150 [Leptospira barantonii]
MFSPFSFFARLKSRVDLYFPKIYFSKIKDKPEASETFYEAGENDASFKSSRKPGARAFRYFRLSRQSRKKLL